MCIDGLLKQNAEFNILHVEMVFDGVGHDCVAHPNYLRLEVKGRDRNRQLWQKESLWNIGAKHLKNASVLFFIDGDILPRSSSWARDIIAKIISNRKLIIQCFSYFQDSLPGSPVIPSWVNHFYTTRSVPELAPGLAWALSREAFLAMGGFNDIYPEGSADTAFVYELFKLNKNKPAWFLDSLRDINHSFSVTYHDETITHINHGRPDNYNNRARILDFLNINLRQLIYVDSTGLLAWRSKNPSIRNIFSLEKCLESMSVEEGYKVLSLLKKNNHIDFNKHFIYLSKNSGQNLRIKQGDFAILVEDGDKNCEVKCYSLKKGVRSIELAFTTILADGEDNIVDLEMYFPQKTMIEFKLMELGGDYRLIGYRKKYSNRFLYKEDISYKADNISHLKLIIRFQFENFSSVKYRFQVERE
jgi:hypothetical protein